MTIHQSNSASKANKNDASGFLLFLICDPSLVARSLLLPQSHQARENKAPPSTNKQPTKQSCKTKVNNDNRKEIGRSRVDLLGVRRGRYIEAAKEDYM